MYIKKNICFLDRKKIIVEAYSRPRDSRHQGGHTEGPLTPLKHHTNMVHTYIKKMHKKKIYVCLTPLKHHTTIWY